MKKVVLVFIVGVVCLSCMSNGLPLVRQDGPIIPPGPTLEITSISLPFIKRWGWSGRVHNLHGPPLLVIVGNYVVISRIEELTDQVITAFDAHTGTIIWQSESIKNVDSLQADYQRVYVGTSSFVRAYNIEMGQLLWEELEQPKAERGSVTDLYVYPNGEQLKVYDTRKGILYTLDAQIGKVVEETRIPSFFFNRQDIYYLAEHRTLSAVDKASGSILWTQEFEGRIHYWPAFIDDTMFINADGQLFALETKTGDTIWHTPDTRFVTSVDQGGNFLYAIREDAAIVGFNPNTGKVIGVVEMTPNQTPRETGAGTGAGTTAYYAIVGSENFMAAYYGNTQELFVFEALKSAGKSK